MAKNKNNKNKTTMSSKNSSASSSVAKDSTKNSHAQVPDNSPSRSGPGGQ